MTHKDFAIQIAKEAGEIIRRNFKSGMNKEWKTDSSPVTETDYAVNKLLIERVKKEFPEMGVLAEEESFSQDRSDLWVCDPVDGTIPFSHHVPICTFSIARVKNGESVLGVAYEPFTDRLIVAEKGKGTCLNDEKMSVSSTDSVKSQIIDIEFWSRVPHHFDNEVRVEQDIDKDGAMILRLCSLVYAAMMVASGEAAGIIFNGATAHDVAAVKVIVEEAGGKVTDLDGNDQRYDREINGAVISNGKLHNYLLGKIKQRK